jgi:hypothetical protein
MLKAAAKSAARGWNKLYQSQNITFAELRRRRFQS